MTLTGDPDLWRVDQDDPDVGKPAPVLPGPVRRRVALGLAGQALRIAGEGRVPRYEASRIPAVKVTAARFPDPGHIELSTTDRRMWTVRIDDVNPDRTLDWCGPRSHEPS